MKFLRNDNGIDCDLGKEQELVLKDNKRRRIGKGPNEISAYFRSNQDAIPGTRKRRRQQSSSAYRNAIYDDIIAEAKSYAASVPPAEVSDSRASRFGSPRFSSGISPSIIANSIQRHSAPQNSEKHSEITTWYSWSETQHSPRSRIVFQKKDAPSSHTQGSSSHSAQVTSKRLYQGSGASYQAKRAGTKGPPCHATTHSAETTATREGSGGKTKSDTNLLQDENQHQKGDWALSDASAPIISREGTATVLSREKFAQESRVDAGFPRTLDAPPCEIANGKELRASKIQNTGLGSGNPEALMFLVQKFQVTKDVEDEAPTLSFEEMQCRQHKDSENDNAHVNQSKVRNIIHQEPTHQWLHGNQRQDAEDSCRLSKFRLDMTRQDPSSTEAHRIIPHNVFEDDKDGLQTVSPLGRCPVSKDYTGVHPYLHQGLSEDGQHIQAQAQAQAHKIYGYNNPQQKQVPFGDDKSKAHTLSITDCEDGQFNRLRESAAVQHTDRTPVVDEIQQADRWSRFSAPNQEHDLTGDHLGQETYKASPYRKNLDETSVVSDPQQLEPHNICDLGYQWGHPGVYNILHSAGKPSFDDGISVSGPGRRFWQPYVRY